MRRFGRNVSQVAGYAVKWSVIATLVGFGGGLGAYALRTGISLLTRASGAIPLWIAPAVGATIAIVIYLIDPAASGFGTDRYIEAVNLRYGFMERKTALTKLLATISTLGFRSSGGVEGPMLIIGGSIANTIDRFPVVRRFFTVHDRRILTMCGAAGALGAAFHSPLAGGIFAVEVLYKASLHYVDLFPAMLSSTMGYVVYSLIDNADPLLRVPEYVPDVRNTIYFVVTAVVTAVVAIGFVKTFAASRKVAEILPGRRLRPVYGALLTGVVISLVPRSAGIGLDVIQHLLLNVEPWPILAALLVAKVLATSLSVGFGGSAGLVIPALFVGAVTGNLMAGLFAGGQAGLLASLVVTGMAAALASVANVPVAAAVLLVEMVGLRLAVPATIGSVIGYVIARRSVIYGDAVQYQSAFAGSDVRVRDRTADH